MALARGRSHQTPWRRRLVPCKAPVGNSRILVGASQTRGKGGEESAAEGPAKDGIDERAALAGIPGELKDLSQEVGEMPHHADEESAPPEVTGGLHQGRSTEPSVVTRLPTIRRKGKRTKMILVERVRRDQ